MTPITETSFTEGFKVQFPDGSYHRYSACRWHDDPAAELYRDGDDIVVRELDSRDNGFALLREYRRPADDVTVTIQPFDPANADDYELNLDDYREEAGYRL